MKVKTILSMLAVVCSAAVVTASASAMDVVDEPVDAEALTSYTVDAVSEDATSEDEIDAVDSEDAVLPISDDTMGVMTEEVTSSSEDVANEVTAEPEDGGTESDSDEKGSPDTGVAGVATAAGAAIVGGGVMLLSRKRK